MAKNIIHKCNTCDKDFKVLDKNSKYCSVDCYRIAQRKGLYRGRSKRVYECGFCGKEVVNKAIKGEIIFCDRKCYNDHRTAIIKARTNHCDYCGKEHQYKAGQQQRQYCNDNCRRLAERAKPINCYYCGTYFTVVYHNKKTNKYISKNTGNKYCSIECGKLGLSNNEERKDKISKAFSGSKHHNWLGGVRSTIKKGYKGRRWLKLSNEIRERDNYTCQDCGITQEETGIKLDVHHIIPFRQNTTVSGNKKSNLISLCKSCHTKADWKYRKENTVQMVLI